MLCLEELQGATQDPRRVSHWIEPLTCYTDAKGMVELQFENDSILATIYGSHQAHEVLHCSYSLNNALVTRALGGEMHVCARDSTGGPRGLCLPSHPFYLALLYQPELAVSDDLHPVITAFLKAARTHHSGITTHQR